MTALFLVAAAIQFAAAFWLWDRVQAATRAAATLPSALTPAVDGWIDRTLLPDASDTGWGGLPVPFRQTDDRYRTMGELVDALPALRTGRDVRGIESHIRALQQLRAVLGDEDGALLGEAVGRLAKCTVVDVPVASVERIEPGELVDPARMRALTPGARVRWSLGLVVRDVDGAILRRADVICA